MDKPIKPKQPDPRSFPKEEGKATGSSPFIIAYKQWQKDEEQYVKDLDIYEQTKLIEDIKRSSIKLCLKKYKIDKR